MLRWWISFSPLSHLSSCHTHTHPYLSRLIFSSLPLGGQVFARIHMPLRPTLNALWWAHIPFSHSQPASSCDSRRTGWNRPKLGGRADCVGDGGGKDDVKGKKEPWVGWGTGLIDVNKNKFTGISSCHFCWKQSTSCFCSLPVPQEEWLTASPKASGYQSKTIHHVGHSFCAFGSVLGLRKLVQDLAVWEFVHTPTPFLTKLSST